MFLFFVPYGIICSTSVLILELTVVVRKILICDFALKS